MSVWEIILIGIALSMDAFAVGLTNGMIEPKMRVLKMLGVAGAYGAFQFFMPVLGYYCGFAFSNLVEKIAPWLSFALLGFIGGKMIFDFAADRIEKRRQTEGGTTSGEAAEEKKLGMGKLLAQALATSIDALAIGVTLLAAETTEGLPFHVMFCSLLIGATTFLISYFAVFAGKRIGNRFADAAQLLGGIILLAIGAKILIESLV